MGVFAGLAGLLAFAGLVGLVGAVAGLVGACALSWACGRLCWACGRFCWAWALVRSCWWGVLVGLRACVGGCGWALVGAVAWACWRLWALGWALLLVSALVGGRFCWPALAGLVGAFAGIVGLGFGRFCWLVGACWRLRALLGAFWRGLLGLLALLGLVLGGCFCCLGALVGAFAGLVAVGVCRRFCRACGRLWALLGLWALSLGLRALLLACGRLRALAGGRCLKDDEGSSGRSQT